MLQSTLDAHVPITLYKMPPSTHFSHHTNVLRVRFTAITRQAEAYGWNPHLYHIYRATQAHLVQSLQAYHRQYWDNLIARTATLHNDLAAFWRQVKNLMGNDQIRAPYVKRPDGTKLQSPVEKETGFREISEEVYSGEDEEGDENVNQRSALTWTYTAHVLNPERRTNRNNTLHIIWTRK